MTVAVRLHSASVVRAVRRKARAALQRELLKHRLWQDDRVYDRWLRDQVRLGRSLSTVHLQNVLGENDYTAIVSSEHRRSLNRPVVDSAPALLAFGYTLGHGICQAIEGTAAESERAGVHAALFNFGIALFDFLLDLPQRRDVLQQNWNHATLNALGGDWAATRTFLSKANDTTCGDVRVLLKVIGAFFKELHSLNLSPNTHERVCALLTSAYDAELRSTRWDLTTSAKLSTSAEKSILPFLIIGALARVHASAESTNHTGFELDPFLRALATTFWLTDDLADVANDCCSDALNSLMVHAEVDGPCVPNNSTEALEWLMKSNAIDEASQCACHHAALACSLLDGARHTDLGVQSLRVSIANYVRSWIQ
jgi:hypothetical protein